MDVTRAEVMAQVQRLRSAADHLEHAEHVEEVAEVADWAEGAARDVRTLFDVTPAATAR